MAVKAPPGLEARGRRLWRDSLAQWSLSPAHLVLLEEACRAVDRLELLDSIIRAGAAGVNDPESESGDISQWLAEARLQAGALKVLLAEIRQGAVVSAKPAKGEEATGVSDLSARITARRKAASS
jgi:hypothetical protein